MIFGIGCDIVKVSRLEKWVLCEALISRFFNGQERAPHGAGLRRKCEFYAARFAAKEAFSKALGTGLCGFSLNEVFISGSGSERPQMKAVGRAGKLLEQKCGKNCAVHVSVSHEKEYAVAYVVIEIL